MSKREQQKAIEISGKEAGQEVWGWKEMKDDDFRETIIFLLGIIIVELAIIIYILYQAFKDFF